MRLSFLRCGGKFHVRGGRRELRALPVGAHPATNVDADAATVAVTEFCADAPAFPRPNKIA